MTKTLRNVFLVLGATALAIPIQAQSLAGTVTANDTGLPLSNATVLLIQAGLPLSQRPMIFSSSVNAAGRYAVAAHAGSYTLCVTRSGLYLDPCQWGGARTAVVNGATPLDVPIRLNKGWRFRVRVHDGGGFLGQANQLSGGALSVTITATGRAQFVLPVTYDTGRIRDYETVVPLSLPMTWSVKNNHVQLTDQSGAQPNPQGTPFQILPSDIPVAGSLGLQVGSHSPALLPDAKVVNLFAIGLR